MQKIRCLVDSRCRLGEAPVWDGRINRLYWSDILARSLHSIDLPSRRRRRWRFDGLVSSLGLAKSGAVVIAITDTVHLFDTRREQLLPIARIVTSPIQRLNDGKIGPDGAVWVGSMDMRSSKEPIASLYRLSRDGQLECKIDGLKVSNGLAWSGDGRKMLHSDSHDAWIDCWDFDPYSGSISQRRRLCSLSDKEGRPDGAATDVKGGYWSAGVSAACLNLFDMGGFLQNRVPMPVCAPTMPCFGGDDMRTLFVTSLCEGLSAERLKSCPRSGGVFSFRVDVPGVPITYFSD